VVALAADIPSRVAPGWACPVALEWACLVALEWECLVAPEWACGAVSRHVRWTDADAPRCNARFDGTDADAPRSDAKFDGTDADAPRSDYEFSIGPPTLGRRRLRSG